MDGTNSSFPQKITTTLVLIVGFLLLVSPTTLAPIDIPAAILFAVGIYTFLLDRNFRTLILRKESLSLIGFGGVALLSYFFTPTDQPSFAVITLYMVALYIIARWICYKGLRENFLHGYKLGASVVALMGVVVMTAFGDTELGKMVIVDGRLTMFFSNPNIFGAFLIPALLLSLGQLFKEDSKDTTGIIVNTFFTVVTFLALLYTESRGVYVSTIVALVAFLPFIRTMSDSYKTKLISLVCGMGIVSLLFVFYIADTAFMETRVLTSPLSRVTHTAFSLQLLAERDVRTLMIGSGNGSYELFSPDSVPAHNTYLRILIENGLLGFGVLTFFFALLAHRLYHEREKDLHTRVIVASLCAILVHGLIADTLHWRHAFMFLGLI